MAQLLSVNGLSVAFQDGETVSTYVHGVSFGVDEGETVCIVGESGCGKTVTALSMMGLLAENGHVTAGEVRLDGQNLLTLSEKAMDQVRGNTLTMIFQDALSSLNPVLTIGRQLTEAIRAHLRLPMREARARAASLLRRVGLSDPLRVLRKYPHTLSGGMRQRVMIAMALCCKPRLLIADEPTTALDVTIQAQIMRLLNELKHEYRMALLLITHDMGLVAEMADRVLVMYAGQVVEEAEVHTLFQNPRHPYTKALLQSVPSIRDGAERRLHAISGTVPEQYQHLQGCRFANRCEAALPACAQCAQALYPLGHGANVRCWRTAGLANPCDTAGEPPADGLPSAGKPQPVAGALRAERTLPADDSPHAPPAPPGAPAGAQAPRYGAIDSEGGETHGAAQR